MVCREVPAAARAAKVAQYDSHGVAPDGSRAFFSISPADGSMNFSISPDRTYVTFFRGDRLNITVEHG
jgi:hypothetical protein